MPPRYRIAGTIILVVSMVLALLLWATLGQSLRAVRQEMRAADTVAADLIGDLARSALLTNEINELQSFVTEAMRSPRFRAILLADGRGQVVVSSSIDLIGTELATHLRDDAGWQVRDVLAARGSVGRLAILFSDLGLHSAYWRTMRFGAFIAVAGLLLVAAVGLALGHRLARPLQTLAAAADDAAAGAPFPAPPRGDDEVSRLARAFSSLVQRLQADVREIGRARDQLALPAEAMAQGFALWDGNGVLLRVNRRLAELLPGAGVVNGAADESLLLAPPAADAIVEIELTDGRLIKRSTARTPSGEVVGIYTDVTRERRRERTLAASEARLRQIMASALDGIVCVDVQGQIETVNEAAGRIFGATPASLVGLPIGRLLACGVGGDDAPASVARLAVLTAGTQHEVSGRHASGTLFPLELAVATVGEDVDRVLICTMRDITQRKRSEARIVHHATHDRLTDLPNRSLLQERLELALDEARRDRECLAVLFVDLDHFKAVNDSLGHQAGDDLLVAVAGRLREAVRAGDTVARIGGDEFIVLARSLRRPGDALGVGQKLMSAMRRPFFVLGHELKVGASAGIAVFPDHGDAPDLLVRHADAALYAAKGGGRGRVRVFRPAGVASADRGAGRVRARAALERA